MGSKDLKHGKMRGEVHKERMPQQQKTLYVVSACLTGENCRYDGGNCRNRKIEALVERGEAVAVCPEILGGLKVPRDPCEIRRGKNGKIRAVTLSGRNCTRALKRGARKALEIVQNLGIERAVLKSRSPSCGFGRIYDGSFSGRLTRGNGITADILSKNGIRIYTEYDYLHVSQET